MFGSVAAPLQLLNEALVHLDEIDLQQGQRRQIGEADAEIVQRELGSPLAQPGHHALHLGGGIIRRLALGELEHHAAQAQLVVAEGIEGRVHHPLVAELVRRQVDADIKLVMELIHAGEIARRLPQHPAGGVVDQRAALDPGNESRRLKQAMAAVPPAHQRLHPEPMAGVDLNGRQIGEEELAPLQGRAHLPLDGEPAAQRGERAEIDGQAHQCKKPICSGRSAIQRRRSQ